MIINYYNKTTLTRIYYKSDNTRLCV